MVVARDQDDGGGRRWSLLRRLRNWGFRSPDVRAEHPTDDQLRARLRSAFGKLAGEDAVDVEAFVADGVITVTGRIESEWARRDLLAACEAVDGVRRVDDRISVEGRLFWGDEEEDGAPAARRRIVVRDPQP